MPDSSSHSLSRSLKCARPFHRSDHGVSSSHDTDSARSAVVPLGLLDRLPTDADEGDAAAMIRSLLCLFALCLVHRDVCDTGLLREVVRTDRAHVLVFTAPASLRAGESELVVVVNDPVSGAPIEGVEIIVKARMIDWDSKRPSMVFASIGRSDRHTHKSLVGLHTPGEWCSSRGLLPEEGRLVVPIEVTVYPAISGWVSYGPVLLLWLPCMLLVLLRDRMLRGRATVMAA